MRRLMINSGTELCPIPLTCARQHRHLQCQTLHHHRRQRRCHQNTGDEKVYEFCVSIESGRYHMVGGGTKLVAQMSRHTTHQEVSQLFTPTQLVGTGIVSLLGQWSLRRTSNGRRSLGMDSCHCEVTTQRLLTTSRCLLQVFKGREGFYPHHKRPESLVQFEGE